MNGSILVVCTGNICRSPVGEAMLASDLAKVNIDVASAGTRALIGSAASPEARDYIKRTLDIHVSHQAVQLTARAAEESDLILTMTEEQRAWVTSRSPRTVRRTYTMLEFARLLPELGKQNVHSSLSDLVRVSAPLRGRINISGAPNDIPDPYGGSPDDYSASFALVAEASRTVADEITEHLPGGM
ncbi:arsenate reductase/protein-tyrosine-phosphatase family protein [Brachybacterium alimentarium]|uniref:arsenate reductase/protein-tyrosine-phosphatase family protein n=1 Tax=Brachybacterium alimentarium TaxID=47845 RepID=UPI003FD20382